MVHLRKRIAFIIIAMMMITSAAPGYAHANAGDVAEGYDAESVANDTSARYQKIIDAEAEWIASLQFDNGAIPTYSKAIDSYNGKYKVIPYFTHIALLGLLEKPEYANIVKKYMDWYFAHLNEGKGPDAPDGSVYDYVVETDRQTETPTLDFDSTDSYASTFLNVLRKYAEVTGDTAYVAEHKEQVLKIASAMLSTQEADGLTWAKPTYRVKYLMDNTEVYRGLIDMAWIAEHIFGDTAEAARFEAIKEQVHTAIQSELWLEQKNMYSPGKTDSGTLLNPDWRTFYADATAQISPIWAGVIAPDSERAIQLYNSFNEHHPGWPTLAKSDAFPWAILASAAALMGDKVRVDQFLQSIEATYVDKDHPWPWYVMESGLSLLTAAQMQKLPDVPVQFDMALMEEGTVIETLPYQLTGTAIGLQDIEVTFIHQLTGEQKVFHAVPEAGTWGIALQGLVNGDYQVKVKAKDRFNNIYFTRDLTVAVRLGAAGEGMAKVTIKAERELLRRNESTSIVIEVFNKDGKQLDLSDAQIAYHMDLPNLLVQESANRFTLRGLPLDPAIQQIKLWAFVTRGNDVLKTDEIAIRISREAASKPDDILDTMSGWLFGRQLPNGALTLNEQQKEIDPAASNIAALGFLLRPETIELAEKYITNYVGSWNWGDRFGVYGTKYEMKLNEQSGEWVSTEDYKSAAASIASFISLQRAYFERTGKFVITQYQLDILTGGLGLMALQAADGLMWSKKDGKIKSLQDNLLVLKGMQDSVWLFRNHFKDEGPAAYFEKYMEMLREGIKSKLWNEEAGAYAMSIDASGQPTPADWTKWEDAGAQLTAIAAGVVAPDSSEAAALYTALNQSFPKWASEGELSGLHGVAAYVATLMGDADRAMASLTRVTDTLKAGHLSADWDVSSAGYAMLAAHAVKDLVKSDKTKLEALISQANQLYAQAQEGTSAGYYPVGSKSRLQAAITAAEAVMQDGAAMQEAVDAAVAALMQAVETFKKSVHVDQPTNPGNPSNPNHSSTPSVSSSIEKAALNQVIADAKSKHATAVEGSRPGEYKAGAKKALQAAIDAAVAIQKLDNATQQQVNEAAAALKRAVIEFMKQVVTEGGSEGNRSNQGTIDFKDMQGHWSNSVVARAASLGIVKGFADSTFRPDQQVTREQFVSMLARALQLSSASVAGSGTTFKDDDQISSWAKSDVTAAIDAKLIQGFQDGTFRPEQLITRTQLAMLAARAAGLDPQSAKATQVNYADVNQIPSWAKKDVAAATAAHFVQGKAADRFDPLAAATRAEAVKVIMAVLDYMGAGNSKK
ncbi:S-layer homology domain-containing protein [Paenibacillus guangzhouensis]|uniref:S-layer homology domain-containing protein n=1 Tax=Paenibacillus guangzhouensis TaxID=1473112 RepID=UPI00126693F8|nr:S-layer homology domain-containing protein [Paenibacillus guangzhouensis]